MVWVQRYLPQQRINRLARILAESTRSWLVQRLIRFWVKRYQVNLSEARFSKVSEYRRFNQFFVRQLRPTARSWPQDHSVLACPVDGALGELGRIEQGSLLQAKGRSYELNELLGSTRPVENFEGCGYATLYLSPRDYHRVHMPTDGQLIGSQQIAGTLFSVSPRTTLAIPRLYVRNRRAVCLFSSEQGPFVMVLVGALIVGGIRLAWEYTPGRDGALLDRSQLKLQLKRGAQMGMFELGSTVVLIAPKDYEWNSGLSPGAPLRLGEPLARLKQ